LDNAAKRPYKNTEKQKNKEKPSIGYGFSLFFHTALRYFFERNCFEIKFFSKKLE